MSEIDSVKESILPRYILGLDVSTSCIGVSVIKDTGDGKPEILYLGHKTPKIPSKIKGIEALFLRKQIFEDEFIKQVHQDYPITDVVIEEPLLSSNNIYTVATLLRFNGMISESIYRVMGLVPNFISSYDARLYSFPELMSIRKYNKKGDEYPVKHIMKALKDNNIVLFGAFPFDIDKKQIMMNMVNDYFPSEQLNWVYNKKGNLIKENFDACDSLVCALAYMNVNRYGPKLPEITEYSEPIEVNDAYEINYTVSIWDKKYPKTLILSKTNG